jgi:hypothetical protein
MATYYWVGGSGTWDSSSNARWSATSGGAGGAGIPTGSDFVIFDTNSAIGSYTVQVSQFSVCARITATAPAGGPGSITFSNTVANDGFLGFWGSRTGAASTSINIYNGAVFTQGTIGILYLYAFIYGSGTSTITFNSSGATTQPISVAIWQGSNGAYSNAINFCNGHTQTFSSVQVLNEPGAGYPSSSVYNTFNCTTATISIIGGTGGSEFFSFGANTTNVFTRGQYQYNGNIVLTSTSITIGTAATRASAPYPGAFTITTDFSGSNGTLSCAGASISILRVPTLTLPDGYYFYISPYFTCLNQFANVTLSNGAPNANESSFGNMTGLSGNLVVSNTVSNAAGLYLSINAVYYFSFTIAGTTTITAAEVALNSTAGNDLTHTGAVSLVGNALGMCSYTSNTNAAVTFSSTLSSTNPTTNTSRVHWLIFNNANTVNFVGNVSLVDTYISALILTTTGAANTWTHGNVNSYSGFPNNSALITGNISLTKGLTTLTKATYTSISGQCSFAALTLSGSTLYSYFAITTTGNLLLNAYSTTTLSLIESGYNGGAGGISVTGTFNSANAGAVNSYHQIGTNSGNISVSSTMSLIDARLYINGGTVSSSAFTHSNLEPNAVSSNSVVGIFSTTAGAISFSKVNYTILDTITANSGASNITVSGSNINFQSIVASTLTLSTSNTSYSTVDVYVFPTIASFTSTAAVSTGVHAIRFLAGLGTTGAISLVDTQITAPGAVSCTTYTHNNVSAAASALTNTIDGLVTTGAISITKALYNLIGTVSANSGAANLSLSLATLQTTSNVNVAALSVSGSTLTAGTTLIATAVTVPNNGTTYSTINVFDAYITSLASTSSSTGVHNISFGSSLTASSTVNIVDTQITAPGAVSCTTYTHSNTAAAAIALTNTFGSSFTTTGAISITKATYNVSSTMSSGATNTTLTGSSLTVGSTLGSATVTLANSVNIYSTLAVSGATSIASLVSTSTGTGAHATTFLSTFATTGLVSLVDTTFNCNGTTSIGTTWTQTKTASGTTNSSNYFAGNATFGGAVSFTNSDVVFTGQTNSVTGTFSFTINSSAIPVSTGGFATNDFPALTFLYDGPSTLSVSGALTITGSQPTSFIRYTTNVRTFVPYINSEPLNLRYNKVTISVGSVNNLSYVNFQNVIASGATPWSGVALGDATGNTGFTFVVGQTRFLVATTGTVQSNASIWANSSGGATSVNFTPVPQDTIVVDNNSASVGAVVVNFASVVYATNIVGQASINRSVTFSRSDRSSLILLGNITLFTPTAGGLVFDKLNVTLANASSASSQILSWPTGYAPIATSNTVQLYTYSLGSMTLSGSTSSSAYLGSISNSNATPASGSYGSFTITEGVETYTNRVEIANSTVNNFTSSTIYTTYFSVIQVSTTAYTLSSAYATFSNILTSVGTNYVGTLNLATTSYIAPGVFVTSIGTLNISIYNPVNIPVYMYIASCTVGNMTGGGTNASNPIFLYGGGGGAGTLTKLGGGFVQLDYVRPYNLSAAPANTFFATNSSLASGGTATGWTFSAAPGGAAGGNFFLEF